MKTIKKRTIIVVLSLLALFAVQNSFAQGAKLGVKGGLSLSHLSIDDANDKNILGGFHLGGWANLPISGPLSLQPELLFSQKGSKWEDKTNTYNAEVKLHLNYLEVPVNLVYNLSKDVDFQLGPYIGFLLSSDSETKISSGSVNMNFNSELDKENFTSPDLGLQGGMRFYVKPIYLGFTYKLGLSQVAKDGRSSENMLGDAANRSIQVYAAFAF